MPRKRRGSRAVPVVKSQGPAYPSASAWGALSLRNPVPGVRTLEDGTLQATRVDGWENPLTGTGTSRDKSQAMRYCFSWQLRDGELTDLYNSEDVAATIVNLPVEEMFRRGFKVEVKQDGPEGEDTDGDEDRPAEALTKLAKAVRLPQTIKRAAKWGRLYGGGLAFIAWNDGQNPALPLRPESIDRAKPIFYTKDFDRRYATVQERDNDPSSVTFGEPLVFSVGLGTKVSVHRSRCIIFHGAEVDERTRFNLDGWTLSVLQRPYDALRQFNQAYASVGNLITDASQGVFKMDNLIALLANGKTSDVVARLQLMDQTRSTSRAIALDAKTESFDRVATPFTGLPEALAAFERRLSAASRIPVTLLMGDSPAGLGATGASDIRFFYDSVSSAQPEMGDKMLEAYGPLATSQGLDPEDVTICWAPLWEATDKEKADTDLAIAQRDVAYVTACVWTPEEVALARSKGITSTTDTPVDEAYRTTTLAQNIDFDTSHTPEEKAALMAPPPAVVDPAAKASPPKASGSDSENKGQTPGPKKPAGT